MHFPFHRPDSLHPAARHSGQARYPAAKSGRSTWIGIAVGVLGGAAVVWVGYYAVQKVSMDMNLRAAQDERQQQLEVLDEYVAALTTAQEPHAGTADELRRAFDKLAQDKATAEEVQTTLDALAKRCAQVQQAIANAALPTTLPSATLGDLYEAKADLLNAYGLWARALGFAAACLENPSPQNLKAVDETQRQADEALAAGAEKLSAVKEALEAAPLLPSAQS